MDVIFHQKSFIIWSLKQKGLDEALINEVIKYLKEYFSKKVKICINIEKLRMKKISNKEMVKNTKYCQNCRCKHDKRNPCEQIPTSVQYQPGGNMNYSHIRPGFSFKFT